MSHEKKNFCRDRISKLLPLFEILFLISRFQTNDNRRGAGELHGPLRLYLLRYGIMQAKLPRLFLSALVAAYLERLATGFLQPIRPARSIKGAGFRSQWPAATRLLKYPTPIIMPAKDSQDDDTFEELQSLERISHRLDGLEVYALVGTLVSTSSFGTLKSFRPSPDNPLLQYDVVLLILGASSCLLSLYATITFLAAVVYGKTAVAFNKDHEYSNFMKSTQGQRSRAFLALSVSILLFSIQVVMVLGFMLPETDRLPVVSVASIGVVLGCLEWQSVFKAAEPIFSVREERQATPTKSMAGYDNDDPAWNHTNGSSGGGKALEFTEAAGK